MLTSSDCIRAGWVQYMAECLTMDLLVYVPKDADLDDVVLAFDHEEKEMIRIKGWLFTWEQVA